MTAAELLARVEEYGARVTCENGRLHLVQPFDPSRRKRVAAELMPLLVEHKSGLLRHFLGSTTEAEPGPVPATREQPGQRCGECGATVWLGAAGGEDVWRTCGQLMCPYWRAEYDRDGWRAQERNREAWRRKRGGRG